MKENAPARTRTGNRPCVKELLILLSFGGFSSFFPDRKRGTSQIKEEQ